MRRERWLHFRNRLIANPGFQRWAARFPLTRPIARRRARALFDLVAGFVYSQVLSACVRLLVFDALAEGPQTVASLAPRFGLTEDAAGRLLKAASALDLAEQLPDGRFALGHLGAALRGNPSLSAMISHHALLYADLADPVALLRGELAAPQLAAFWAYAKNPGADAIPPAQVAEYSALMGQTQALVAGEVLDAYPMRKHRCLLDIGGGEGAFLRAAGARFPHLRRMLFDLPAVTARVTESGISLHPGSFFADPLPQGADIATLVRVLHDHDDAAARAILHRARAALPPGGVLLVAEPMAATKGAAPMGEAYFGFYLAAMGSGRPRTAPELTGMLREAGFQRIRAIPTATPLVTSLLAATA